MPTELFKVTCVTCQAKLSVRNAALVGQIVACPKCNSMVEIAPPVAPAPVAAAVTVAPVVAAAAAPTPTPTLEEPLDHLADEPTATDEFASVLESTASGSNVNFIIWSVASFVIGVTLTGLFLILRSGSDDAEVVAAEPAAAAPIEEVAAVPVEAPSAEPIVDAQAPETAPPSQATEILDEDPAAPEIEPTLLGPVEEPAKQEETPPEPPETPAATGPEPKLVIAEPESPRVARKFDPLALDPEQLSLDSVSEAAKAGEDTIESDVGEDAPVTVAPPVNLPVRINQDSRGLSGNRSANVQLRQAVPALSVKDMPLIEFLALTSQMAGVPVSVTPEQLMMAGTTSGRAISVEISSASLLEVLEKALGPVNLEATTDGPHIVVRRQDADKVRTVAYPIDDLLGPDQSTGSFAKWIEALIAPESWQARGGDGRITVTQDSLTVEQTQAVQYQILFFLERIRLYKGTPLRSRYPERLLSAQPLAVRIADRLHAPATFTFSHETPLAEVIRHWQGELGMPIFIDWPALGTEDIWPDTLVTCAIANEPWHAALDKILGPLDLGWRPAPGGAIEITSRARVETEPQLEIYPEGTWQGDSTDAVVINDPVNELTYVRAPASRFRQ